MRLTPLHSKFARPRAVPGRVPIFEPLESRQLFAVTLPAFTETDLVSDGATPAQQTDPNLVNPWGIAITKSGAIWVADNGPGVSTLYDQSGNPSPPVVTIPPPTSAAPGTTSTPTGVVFNNAGTKAFLLPNSTTPAEYVFVTEDGTISGWDPSVGNSAALIADNSGSGAVYKGVAIAGKGKRARLFAANFNAGTIEVLDSTFQPATLASGAFTDSSIPAGFAPFNVQTVGNKVYVTYAMQDAAKHDDVPGAGNGFVDVFNANGKMIRQLAAGGVLNSPWAVTRLPGARGADIAVGNFGDGTINVFTPSGKSLGALMDATTNQPISIDGLWGLTPGVGTAAKTLFFAAGTNGEADGLFGTLTAQKAPKARVAGNSTGAGGGTGTGTGTGSGTGTGTGTGGGFNYGAVTRTSGTGGASTTSGTANTGSSSGAITGINSTGSSFTPLGMSDLESSSILVNPISGTTGTGSTNDVLEPVTGITGMGSINDVNGITGLASIAGPAGASGMPSINDVTGTAGMPSISDPTGTAGTLSIAGPAPVVM